MAFKSSVNLGLPNVAEPPDPTLFGEFTRVYNAIRNLAIALDAYTGTLAQDASVYSQILPTSTLLSQNMLRFYVKASENIAYGEVINVHDVAGVANVQRASALTTAKPMHGWCSTAGGILSGAYGEVMLGGLCTAISGLTIGTTYFLADAAGAIAATAGTTSQKIGYAIGSAYLIVQPALV